jgi:hypothetical protein
MTSYENLAIVRGYENLAVVWARASRSSDNLGDYAVTQFLTGNGTELAALTRGDLREVDEELLVLIARLPAGPLRAEVQLAHGVLLDLYFVADEDDDMFDNWDGVTPPGLLWELVV